MTLTTQNSDKRFTVLAKTKLMFENWLSLAAPASAEVSGGTRNSC